jgi:hydrogenase expression/formation protein HypE
MEGDKILLAHGSGGQLSHELVEQLFLKYLSHPALARLDDSAVVAIPGFELPILDQPPPLNDSSHPYSLVPVPKLAFTTDSYVVSPIFFPGGDIGKLAVCGTVNDLAMSGARPLYLSAGFILEEGLLLSELEQVVVSMATVAEAAGAPIVTGDTKVVDRGKADKLFVNTAGIGLVAAGVEVGSQRVQPGDAVILSGTVGDHGMAIMSQREGLSFASPLVSDCAPLNGLVTAVLEAVAQQRGEGGLADIHCLRDPTRGGLATTLNEVAGQSRVGLEVDECAIPVHEAVRAACEMLGLDPLYVANEGKLVAFVAPQLAGHVLEAMRAHEYGRDAAIIGQAVAGHAGRVVLRTALGARRILSMLAAEQLPRIC